MDLARNQEMLKVSTALKKIGLYSIREGKYGEIVCVTHVTHWKS